MFIQISYCGLYTASVTCGYKHRMWTNPYNVPARTWNEVPVAHDMICTNYFETAIIHLLWITQHNYYSVSNTRFPKVCDCYLIPKVKQNNG